MSSLRHRLRDVTPDVIFNVGHISYHISPASRRYYDKPFIELRQLVVTLPVVEGRSAASMFKSLGLASRRLYADNG